MDILSGRTPANFPEGPTLVDSQGRERLVQPARVSSSYKVGTESAKAMAPLASQVRKESRAKAAQALGLADADEVRGRTKTRMGGPRNMSYEHYLPAAKRLSDASDSSDDERSDAQRIAHQYHTLLSQQYRTPSDSPASNRTESDTEIKSQMKMVPQPLFHSKPPAKLPGTITGRSGEATAESFPGRVDSGHSDKWLRRSSSGRGSFPLRLSLSSGAIHRRRSTSGTIPISPPSASLPSLAAHPAEKAAVAQKNILRLRRKSDDGRVSAYYP